MPNLGLHMCGHFVQILCQKASTEVGSAAAGREDKKVDKYSNLSDHYHFVPVNNWVHQYHQKGQNMIFPFLICTPYYLLT